jgi:hypothetical protein
MCDGRGERRQGSARATLNSRRRRLKRCQDAVTPTSRIASCPGPQQSPKQRSGWFFHLSPKKVTGVMGFSLLLPMCEDVHPADKLERRTRLVKHGASVAEHQTSPNGVNLNHLAGGGCARNAKCCLSAIDVRESRVQWSDDGRSHDSRLHLSCSVTGLVFWRRPHVAAESTRVLGQGRFRACKQHTIESIDATQRCIAYHHHEGVWRTRLMRPEFRRSRTVLKKNGCDCALSGSSGGLPRRVEHKTPSY